MTYPLEITFAGLCLFVLNKGRLHVLMPDTAGIDTMSASPHVTVLRYQRGTSGKYVEIPIDQCRLSFPGTGTYANPGPKKGVQNITPLFDPPAAVNNRYLATTGSLDSVLASHVMATGAGTLDPDTKLCMWHGYKIMQNGTIAAVQLVTAALVSWTMQIATQRLDLSTLVVTGDALTGNVGPDPSGVIRVQICHVPEEELGTHPPKPNPPTVGTPAVHFRAYYNLFVGKDMTKEPLPMFDSATTDAKIIPSWRRGMNPYTCMLGGGDG